MRKIYILTMLLALGVPFRGWTDVRVQQASPAVYADIELPFRCVSGEQDKEISRTIALSPDDFSFVPMQSGDALPRYAVNGYSFHKQPADQALSKLLKTADIKVVAPKSEYALLDGDKVTGELSSVVAQLAEVGEVFYTYNADKKRLVLRRRADYLLKIPHYRPVLMTVLDALRGSGIENLNVDWEQYQIRMTVSQEELQKAKKLVQQMLHDSYLLVADIQGYQVIPHSTKGSWQGVLNDTSNIVASMGRSVVGRYVVLKKKVTTDSFLNKMKSSFQLKPLLAGQAFVPNGWQMKFNMGECVSNGMLPYPDMSMVLKTQIQDGTYERTKVILHTAAGVLTKFDLASDLNQEAVLFGIPSKVGNAELLFTLKFGLVRFIQKGE